MSYFVPEEHTRDTTPLIFDELFPIAVPNLQSTSIDHLRRYGSYTTFNTQFDRELANQWINTEASIDVMIEHFRQGTMVKLRRYMDAKKIYDNITEHLRAWKYQLDNGINIGAAPFDDLLLMDQFAHKVYEHAKYMFTPEVINNYMGQGMAEVSKLNAFNFFEAPKTVKPQAPVPEREGMGEFLRNRLVNITSRRFG